MELVERRLVVPCGDLEASLVCEHLQFGLVENTKAVSPIVAVAADVR
jgi:hypothetical protein